MAAITRTSTFTVRVPPTRSNSPSWSTRRSLTWVLGVMLADLVEEDRAAVGELEPPLRLARTAPVKAPFS